MSILVVGSVAFDTIKTPFKSCKRVLGGSATYFSTSASLFSPVRLVAVVGRDFPGQHLDFFKRKGIDTRGLEIKKGKTFHWQGEYSNDFSDAKTIKTCLNLFADFKPHIPKQYKSSPYVFLANIDPRLQGDVLAQVKTPKLIFCDTMNLWISTQKTHLLKLLKKVDVFLLNESESKQLTSASNIVEVARRILKLGPKIVIIKKGEHGAALFTKRFSFCLPGLLLDSVVDPTGAGDTFAGGFVGFLAKVGVVNEKTLKRAVAYGTVMASFAVEDFSLRRLGSVTKSDISKRYNQLKSLTGF